MAIYAHGELDDGGLYIVMEWLSGESLAARLARVGRVDWRVAIEIVRATAVAIAEAHRHGVIHRDVKPANIFLESWGDREVVRVLDFGIAKLEAPASIDVTKHGELVGTVEYMAPEQLLGRQVDGRTDVFALGLVLFEMLAGRRPFEISGDDRTAQGSIVGALFAMQRHAAPPIAAFAMIPPALQVIVNRCLAYAPDHRFESVDALVEALDQVVARTVDDRQTQVMDVAMPRQRLARGSFNAGRFVIGDVPRLAPPAPERAPSRRGSSWLFAAALVVGVPLAAMAGWCLGS